MNTRRKINKAARLAEYHFYRGNYKKSMEQYLRMWKYDKWFTMRESFLDNLVTCLCHFWKHEKALKVVDVALTNSPYCYEHIKNKAELLEHFWKHDEAKIYQDMIQKIDIELKDDSLLDNYLQHIS